MDDFASENIFDFQVVEVHGWWPGYVDPFWQHDSLEIRPRINFMSGGGGEYSPHLRFDGIGDGGSTPSPWPGLLAARRAVSSPLTMEMSLVSYNPGTRVATVRCVITNVSGASVTGQYRLVAIESHLFYAGANGLTDHNFAVRDYIDSHLGDAVTLAPGANTTIDKTFTLATWANDPTPPWTEDNVVVVGFVQNNGTREIYQGARLFYPFDLPFLTVGSEAATEQSLLLGDGDGLIDPGETGEIVVGLANLNPLDATNASATLTTADPSITVTDGSSAYGTITRGVLVDNASDPFVIEVSPTAPSGYHAAFSVDVTADGGYAASLPITVPIGSPTDRIGPDAGGYYAYESGDASDPEVPTYNWIEIDPGLGGAGTLIPLSDDSDAKVQMPFFFRWYGVNKDSLTISSNGWIAIGRWFTTGGDNSPSHIPDADGPGSMIAGMWADLNPQASGGGKIYRYYDAAGHRYIVEYSGVEHFHDTGLGQPETFQFQIYDPAFNPTINGDGEIIVMYKDVRQPNDVVAGIENSTESTGIEYQFFNTLNPSSQGLADLRAVKYTPDPPTVATSVAGTSPAARVMLAASPNPMRQGTTLRYALPKDADVKLRVFGVDGRLVTTLVSGRVEAGRHEVRWDAQAAGQPVASGIYFARLETGGQTLVEKLILTR